MPFTNVQVFDLMTQVASRIVVKFTDFEVILLGLTKFSTDSLGRSGIQQYGSLILAKSVDFFLVDKSMERLKVG